MLEGTYSPLLVVFSVLVAMLASYTALDLVGRISSATGRAADVWLGGGAVAMGLGIWSMHFVGMLAFSLPIDIGYSIPYTLMSLFIAIASSMLALWLASHGDLPVKRLSSGALLMGGGISAMHYTGMAAMQMDPGIRYVPWIVALSIAVAVLASGAALWIAVRLREFSRHVRSHRLLAAVIMGFAIVGMHYIGMAAAEFPIGSVCGALARGLNGSAMALPILVVTIAVLTVALITSILDMRLEINTAILSSSLAEANEELSQLVLHDTLTRLPNRLLLMDRLEQSSERAREAAERFAVMFIDLDGFKAVNDTFGHQAGDQLLIQAAERIRANVHASDTCARLGGDEFVVVAAVPTAADASAIADRLVAHLQETFSITGHPINVSASIGIAVYPADGATGAELLRNADTAMYHAKSLGRNRSSFYEGSMNDDASNQLTLLNDLRQAPKRGELMLHYQPKFQAPAGPMIGVEALLRWNHPRLGMIAPNDFIPLAERTGLIVQIGEWVIDEACRQMALWRKSGNEAMTIAVNISAIQFNHGRFVSLIDDALERHGIPPNVLILEITESTAMENVEATLAILETLRARGVGISIDDFGTGYSSLLHLKRFQAKELKIDRGFVNGLMNGAEDAAIVTAIVALGETLKLNIVAEGVETDEQRAMLTHLGCDVLQGFLLGKPMLATDVTALLPVLAKAATSVTPAARRIPEDSTMV